MLQGSWRGERKVLCPSQGAIEVDDEGLIALERLDKREARFSSDCDRRCKGIGKSEREFPGYSWVMPDLPRSATPSC